MIYLIPSSYQHGMLEGQTATHAGKKYESRRQLLEFRTLQDELSLLEAVYLKSPLLEPDFKVHQQKVTAGRKSVNLFHGTVQLSLLCSTYRSFRNSFLLCFGFGFCVLIVGILCCLDCLFKLCLLNLEGCCSIFLLFVCFFDVLLDVCFNKFKQGHNARCLAFGPTVWSIPCCWWRGRCLTSLHLNRLLDML